MLVCAATSVPALASSSGTVRLGSAPQLPSDARVIGAVDPATPVHLTIALKPRDPAALEAFATAVSTPGSPIYRDYITPAQFAQRFGPTSEEIAAVDGSLRAHGLSPGPITANHLAIRITAAASTVQSALGTTLERLSLPGRVTGIVNVLAPRLDAGIANLVQAVIGLNGTAAPRPLLARPQLVRPTNARAGADSARPHVATGGPQPCTAAASAAPAHSAHTADQLASAYGYSGLYRAGDEGQGETIALYELEPNDPADITAFQSCYGTHASVTYVPVDGGAGTGPGSGEAALDIEAAIGLAPRANIVVYQAPNSNSNSPGAGPFDNFAAIVSQDQAQVVSASWGQCEAVEGSGNAAAESTLFQEAAAQGQTFVSAAGDTGSEDCYTGGLLQALNAPLAVDDPASQPFVTGVGGTTLSALGPRPAESVWNAGGNAIVASATTSGAGGGGVSALWRMPSYQSGAPSALRVQHPSPVCGAAGGFCREVPDVSADADPATGYLIYWNGAGAASGPSGWQTIGGTSLAAPMWAGLIALADALPQCGGAPIGFANPGIYRAAATAYGTNFNDVSTGNNDFTGSNGSRFAAGAGYDMASGLGTPNASSLAPALCADSLRLANPGPTSSTVRKRVAVQIRVSGPAAGVRFGATGLPAGLGIDPNTGLISGVPRRIGTYGVTVSARDAVGESTRMSFLWTVGGPPTASHGSLRRGRLALTVTHGRDAPALARIRIALPHGLRFRGRARTLTDQLPAPAASVRVTARVRPRRIHARRVRVTLTVTDVLGHTTRLTVRLRVG
jgi:subtilase family serine protease